MAHAISLETRIKISIAMTGHSVSTKTRKKMSASQTGKTVSKETRAKESIRMTGRTGFLSPAWKGGKSIRIRKENARRRILGFIPLNSWFDGCEGHHVDCEQVIFLPKELHRSIYHRQTDGRGMAKINAIAYNYLFKQEVNREQ